MNSCQRSAGSSESSSPIAIDPLQVLGGSLPPRVLGLVVEWALSHRSELMNDWSWAKSRSPLEPIEPLR
ncbi:MAG TPA: DUF4160 domain-containing protein [Verrucomicrobiae bacterium]|nr:DUF4160 domain-containing protein [Verrucomicrobiae bacterium]